MEQGRGGVAGIILKHLAANFRIIYFFFVERLEQLVVLLTNTKQPRSP